MRKIAKESIEFDYRSLGGPKGCSIECVLALSEMPPVCLSDLFHQDTMCESDALFCGREVRTFHTIPMAPSSGLKEQWVIFVEYWILRSLSSFYHLIFSLREHSDSTPRTFNLPVPKPDISCHSESVPFTWSAHINCLLDIILCSSNFQLNVFRKVSTLKF
jgi:hypothetical protein